MKVIPKGGRKGGQEGEEVEVKERREVRAHCPLC